MEKVEKYEFAVVDVETTGLFPSMHDRIVEIATFRVDPNGNILKYYSTLVNPNRDIGATHIHGISARDVKNAPLFDEIAGDVLAVISDAIFVAHNVNFDWKFVRAEFERIGIELPYLPKLCTMRLSSLADPSITSRKLENICRHFDISIRSAHSAYDDAYATLQIMAKCLKKIGNLSELTLSDIGVKSILLEPFNWPVISPSGKSYSRQQAVQESAQKQSYISKLISKLPSGYESHPELNEYLDLLDKVIEDRRITANESQALLHLSMEIGLYREQAIIAHHKYMKDLMFVALEDGIITDSEMRDLKEVKNLLSISEPDFDHLLKKACEEYELNNIKMLGLKDQYDVKGKTICFTGKFGCKIEGELVKRSKAEEIVIERGMVVKKNVTRDLDFLVMADPHSMSGKAKKARAYCTRIIAEPVFWQIMGIQVE
jgi:DNA polymerase-3 subunit epsilon